MQCRPPKGTLRGTSGWVGGAEGTATFSYRGGATTRENVIARGRSAFSARNPEAIPNKHIDGDGYPNGHATAAKCHADEYTNIDSDSNADTNGRADEYSSTDGYTDEDSFANGSTRPNETPSANSDPTTEVQILSGLSTGLRRI